MTQNMHVIRVTLHDDRSEEPIDGGTVTVYGQPYEMTEDQALDLVLASEHLNLEAPANTIRWKGTMIPREHFVRLEASVVAMSKGVAAP